VSDARRKGTAWESAIVDFLRRHGHPNAERRALGGAKDRGDIAGIPGMVIEAKAAKTILLGPWLDETEQERDNDRASYGALWIKRRGYTCPGRSFVVMTGDDFVKLLADAGHGHGTDPWGGP